MNVRLPILFLLLLLVAPLPAGAGEEPTLDDVQQALDEWGDGAPEERGQARLRRWGAAALPHLRTIAVERGGRRLSLHLVRAVRAVGTPEAVELYVLVLEGKTRVPGDAAVTNLYGGVDMDGFLRRLRKHDRFKAAVLRYENGNFRSWVATMIAAMRWMDEVPRLRRMLEDEDLDVRDAAAQALRDLTGEEIAVERPELAFPAVDLWEQPLGVAIVLPTRGRRDANVVAAMAWLDGAPRLVYGFDPGVKSLGYRGELCITDADLDEPETWPMPYEVEALLGLPTPDGARQVVGLVDVEEEGKESWKTVMAWRADGLERWRVQTPQRFMKCIATLHGPKGPVGVAIGAGGDTGVVAVDLDGAPLWDVPKQYVMYELRTHPRLPGSLLQIDGGATLYLHRGEQVRGVFETSYRDGIFLKHGVLFPNAEGNAAFVAAGVRHEGDVPIVRRVDQGKMLWEAELPHEVVGLAMLEPKDGPRLIAATTDRGELLLFDDAGTLRWRGETPEADPNDRVATYRIAAGEIGPGAYGVLIRHLQEAYLYRLDLGALKATEEE